MKKILIGISLLTLSIGALADIGVASGKYAAKKWDNNLLKENQPLQVIINSNGTVVLNSKGFAGLNSLKGKNLEVIAKKPGVYALKEFPYLLLITRESGKISGECPSELVVVVAGAEGSSISCTERQ